ncbi:MAG: PQQ-dependent sugar dehydrogenase [Planctomycetes bacterium]|nr:PQQ-dependent sugar dehydrogenase [Planctomycetota bacterium]
MTRIAALIVLALGLLFGAAAGQVVKNGYRVDPYWSALPANPTAITFDPTTGVCYCLTMSGRLMAGIDGNGDNVIDQAYMVYNGDADPNHVFPFTGLTWHNGSLFMSSRSKVSRLDDTNGDLFIDNVVDLVVGLPTSNHQNNAIVFDPNGDLLFSLGSLTDYGPEPYAINATILKVPPTGGTPTIWATGVRNAYGLAWKAPFGLVAVDNGPNLIASNPDPPDELLVIEQGKDYGYPLHYGDPPPGSGTEKPVLNFGPHSGPCAIDFNPGSFSGWPTDLYVPFLASPVGIVARCSMHKLPGSGEVGCFMEPFAWGFGNPIDAKFAPDGALIIADHTTFNLYRITAKDPSLIKVTGTPALGNALSVEIEHPNAANDFYGFFLSTSDAPVHPLGNGKNLNLNVNTLLFGYCMTPGNEINYFPFPGVLDANGRATGTIYLPQYPPLKGQKVHMAWVSWNAAGQINAESAPLTFVVL